MMVHRFDGGCHCGFIKYQGEADPEKAAICHCTDCQTLSGSAFRTVVPVSSDTFRMTAGEPTIYVKTAESGNKRQQAFCPKCGSPIFSADPADGPKVYMIRAGLFTNGASGLTSQEALSSGDYAGITWLGSIYNWIDDDQDPQTPDVPLLSTFDGVPLSGGEIILKYTWFGDADLSGLVDAFDDSLLSAGFFGDPEAAKNPWLFGDFDYDGEIDAFTARVLLIHHYRRVVLRDPLLPAALLPRDWPGRAARELCGEIYRGVLPASEQWLDGHASNENGALPAAGKGLYRRFAD